MGGIIRTQRFDFVNTHISQPPPRAHEAPAERRPEAPTPLRVALTPNDALARLDFASRRGRLPGFHHERASDTFTLRIYGELFDRELIAGVRPDDDAPGRCVVSFRLRLLPLTPALAAGFAAFAVWPGVWFMDSILVTYIPSSAGWIPTWTWYVPLTVIPMPFAARAVWRKSNTIVAAELAKTTERIVAALGDGAVLTDDER